MKRKVITGGVALLLIAAVSIGIYASGIFSAGTTIANTACKNGDGHDLCDKEKEGLQHQEGKEEHAEDDGHGHSEVRTPTLTKALSSSKIPPLSSSG